MNYWFEAKSRRIDVYREALESCLREADLLMELIQAEESEAVPNLEGDILSWIDSLSQEDDDDDETSR